MKKTFFIFIVLVLSLLYYSGVLTKRETLPLSKEFFSVETPDAVGRPLDLKQVWDPTSQGGARNSPKSTKDLDHLYQLQLDKGIRNYPLLSFMLMREAKQAVDRGNPDQAVLLASYAIKFSPELPQPYVELAKTRWYQNPFQLHRILPELFRAGMAQLRYYPNSLKFFYNLFYIVTNAILMTFVVFGIVILAKYLPLNFYDIRKNLGQDIPGLFVNSAKILVLFVPFFLRLDILWAILFWSLLLWGYLGNKERHYVIVFFILLVYLPFFIRSSSTFLDSPSSDVVMEISQANHEDWDKGLQERLEAWLSTHPDDIEVLFTLGLIEKREGRYDRAELLYRKVAQQAPRLSEAFSNLGNIYLARKQTEKAIASYQQAIDLHPSKGAYYYNLYRAHSQQTFLSGKADQAFQKARRLDPTLVNYYSSIDSPQINRLVIDEVLSAGSLWMRFLNEFIGREGLLYRLFKAWFEKISSRIFMVPIFFLALLIGMSRYTRSRRFLTRCPMCGNPTYRFYLGATDQDFICFNCHRIFVEKERLHPKIKEKRSLQVERFQKQNRFMSRFLSCFLVGFGDLWRGQSLRGLIFLFVFFVFILRFAYWDGVMTPTIILPSPAIWRGMFWGGLFVLFYLLSIRRIYRWEPKVQPRK
jgi:tetratricopeptide (TPR) repeat protein